MVLLLRELLANTPTSAVTIINPMVMEIIISNMLKPAIVITWRRKRIAILWEYMFMASVAYGSCCGVGKGLAMAGFDRDAVSPTDYDAVGAWVARCCLGDLPTSLR